MDLDELLSYKPQKKAGKRPLDDEELELEDNPPSSKVPRRTGPTSSSSGGLPTDDFNGVTDKEKLRLLQSLDDDDEPGLFSHTY